MAELIRIVPHDNAFIKVYASDSVSMELSHHFCFMAPNAQHHPKVKKKLWDGKIRLFNLRTRTIWAGLRENIIDFAQDNGYEVDDLTKQHGTIDEEKVKHFVKYLNLPEEIEPRDYQLESLRISVREKRAIILSPTSSGKSLTIYMLARWFNKRTLIVVPTTTLVVQLAKDFADYGYNKEVRQIMAKSVKTDLPLLTVTTWQSAYAMPKEWLQQFDVIIGDEAHTFKAKSLQGIMENIGASVRIGLTGSLDGLTVNELSLQGMFGKIHRVATTKELMDRGLIADLEIHAYHLVHPEEVRKHARKEKFDYHDEIAYLTTLDRRNRFVRALTMRLTGNRLILFKNIEHGKAIYELIKEQHKNVHFVYGEVDTGVREEIRQLTEVSKDSIIVASYKTFATGINIRNLHHVILGAPIKSKILLIQSIGRALRLGDGKTEAYVHDIGDDLRIGAYSNHTYRHFEGRLELYEQEQFKYKLMRVQL